MNRDDFRYATVSTLIGALAQRKVSAVELTDAAIARIEQLDGAINAVVVRDFDRARTAAQAADAALKKGEQRALLGIPMTVKEAHNVAGLPTTWGFPGFAGGVASRDSAGIARLKAAGAVILGKTNVPVLLADWQANNPLFGRTNNPWDLTRSPGGSSGGGAAAVASGMVALEYGSDFAGSIRVPAALCGIYGHKSSYNIISMEGFAPPNRSGGGVPVSVLGPLARSPDDLERALLVLAGPSSLDAVGYRLELPPPRHARLADFRVLVLDHHPATAVDAELVGALNQLGDRLERSGVKVARRSELVPDLARIFECFGIIIGVATSRGAPPKDPLPTHAWMDLLDEQLAIRRQWGELFRAFDVVLAPAFGTAAFPHQEPRGERTLQINGRATPYHTQAAWSTLAGLGNLPSTVAPIGKTQAGLPVGIQIIGPYLEDRTTIQFARLLEPEFAGFTPPPN